MSRFLVINFCTYCSNLNSNIDFLVIFSCCIMVNISKWSSKQQCCYDFQIKSHSLKSAKHVSIFSNIIFTNFLKRAFNCCNQFLQNFVSSRITFRKSDGITVATLFDLFWLPWVLSKRFISRQRHAITNTTINVFLRFRYNNNYNTMNTYLLLVSQLRPGLIKRRISHAPNQIAELSACKMRRLKQ